MTHTYRRSSAPDGLKRLVPGRMKRFRLVVLAVRNLLRDQSMYRTIMAARPVRPDGTPVPWFTLPATEYLDQFDLSTLDVFEYGSGYSTLYWQERAASVTAIEDDPGWFEELSARISRPSVSYRFYDDRESYVRAIQGRKYDIVVIDGSWREQCAEVAVAHLTETGMIIFDNADWYPSTAAQLRDAGLIEIDFTGFAPGNAYTSTTSLFMMPAARLRPKSAQPRVGAGGMPENVKF